jgi:hypothetical protein
MNSEKKIWRGENISYYRGDRGHFVYGVRCAFGSYLYPFEMSLFSE